MGNFFPNSVNANTSISVSRTKLKENRREKTIREKRIREKRRRKRGTRGRGKTDCGKEEERERRIEDKVVYYHKKKGDRKSVQFETGPVSSVSNFSFSPI